MEKRLGIPYELQKVYHSGQLLDDNRSLWDQHVSSGGTLKLEVDLWWNKLISLSLQGNTATLCRRVSIPMQQIGETNRIFVTLFVCATRGNTKGVDNLLTMHKDFDLTSTTRVTGRTVVLSGSLKCVEEVKKHAGMRFEQLLNIKDKSGETVLDGLSINDERMLNYVNKFLSSPIDIEQLKNKDSNENPKKSTFIVEPGIKEIKEKQNKGTIKEIIITRENNIPRLDRSKEETQGNITSISQIEYHFQTPTISVAPIVIEKTENSRALKVGEAKQGTNDQIGHLPVMAQRGNSVQMYSPRPMRKTSQSSYVPHISNKQPRPPTQDKKRAAAGKMMESNLRKFSAANPRAFTPIPQIETAKDNDQGTGDQVVIEIEEERINKPWNSWIKAVTVEADTPTDEIRAMTPEGGKGKLQVQGEHKDKDTVRKKSFDQLIMEKAQEEQEQELQKMRETYEKEKEEAEKKASHHGKSFKDWMIEKENARLVKEQQEQEQREIERREAEQKAKQQGKTFEQWVKEKEEYNRLLKQQQEHDEKENQNPQKS